MSTAQLIKLENERKEEALAWYKRVRDLWPAMMNGQPEAEREWLVEGEKLVEMFRSTTSRVMSRYRMASPEDPAIATGRLTTPICLRSRYMSVSSGSAPCLAEHSLGLQIF